MNAQLQAVNVAPLNHPLLNAEALKRSAMVVIDTEAHAIGVLKNRIDDAFLGACQLMFDCPGRVVVSGMGKSGHIARKIAATLASTGTPAFFVHPGEASHGDLGMITQKDVVLALSNSGETDELLTILPVIKRQGIPLIVMTGNPGSSLAAMGDVHLDVSVPAEACPLGPGADGEHDRGPGDGRCTRHCLARSTRLHRRGFRPLAPGWNAGPAAAAAYQRHHARRRTDPAYQRRREPVERPGGNDRKGLGMTAIVDAEHRLLGVFTDGDLRRAVDNQNVDLRTTPVTTLMTVQPKTITGDKLAIEAARLMEAHKIHALLVVDADNHIVGALNIHDLLRAAVV